MSTSISPTSRSCAAVAGLPFTKPRERAPESHGAAQDAGAITLVQVLRGQPIAHGGQRIDVEIRAHVGARRAGAHDARIRAPAQGQSERIDEDRLARARLAGERGESRSQLEIEPLDDHIIPDG
jgi:hypothetical protein